ncbi:hypothetical protein BPNPMPFG_006326 [Mesorhizobium sp. AR07]|uniref:hypothetical protein n=1 Tax=Mesorhizobium sp. AR07 TaxID=2865838 RepID=UPI002160D1A0|nr:hypothetical protein [Mesorhizobium sp. AR07]UVK44408.1 hypothetical protein BPNPMPFG_006326 [Mesorhizobium sp. AR07]
MEQLEMQGRSMREKAGMILLVCHHLEMKAGDILPMKTILHLAATMCDLCAEEVAEGIDQAFEYGWVAGTRKGSAMLTEVGLKHTRATG